ncbi:hypothetical protein BG006_004507 [Podila minutissima]|uniref:Uncharacterized protein n=1 Tax=Podila minutissima TaxID=64525 RepID=A0A9P5SVT1_9FUNG|nr:hypothetical protein BG006_004507 [Podila minutissima]
MKFAKIAILALAAPVSVALAAPAADDDKDNHYDNDDHHYGDYSKCTISAFKPSWSKIAKCCHKYKGDSDFDKKRKYFKCKLPIYYEGYMRKCIKDLDHACTVDCYY